MFTKLAEVAFECENWQKNYLDLSAKHNEQLETNKKLMLENEKLKSEMSEIKSRMVNAFKCKFCEFEAIHENDLKQHKLDNHMKKCDICDQSFTQNLIQFHRNRCKEKNHICDICKKQFSQKTILKIHMKAEHKN